MPDRCRGTEETLVGDARELGDDLVRPGRVCVGLAVVLEGDPATPAAELLLEDAVADVEFAGLLVPVLDDELDSRGGAALLAGAPGAESLELRRRSGGLAEKGQFDATLDRRLTGLVRSANDREAGRQLEVKLAVHAKVAKLQTEDPHRPALLTVSPDGLRGDGAPGAIPRGGRPALRPDLAQGPQIGAPAQIGTTTRRLSPGRRARRYR